MNQPLNRTVFGSKLSAINKDSKNVFCRAVSLSLAISISATLLLSMAGCKKNKNKDDVIEPNDNNQIQNSIPDHTDTEEKKSNELNYKLNETETEYIVVGIGDCTDTNVVIPSTYNGLPVTEIASKAFFGCNTMQSLTIPESVLKIGTQIISECKSITTLYYNTQAVPKDNIFNGLESLTTVSFGGGSVPRIITDSTPYVKNVIISPSYSGSNIPASIFGICASIETVEIKSNAVKEIGQKAFSSCVSLKTVKLSDSVRWISSAAFFGCIGLTSINLPSGLTSIASGAFYGCSSLKSIKIPGSVTELKNGSFSSCTSLKKVVIEDGVTIIGERVFENCSSLSEITIPTSIESIFWNAFDGCKAGLSMTYTGSKEMWSNIPIKNSTSKNALKVYTIKYLSGSSEK